MKRRAHTFVSNAGLMMGRSFCPLFAIAIIGGAMFWGPWVSLGITVLAFVTAMRFV
jgi:hypothetical protein